jgi:aldehyde dehydrogenase (NAD+)
VDLHRINANNGQVCALGSRIYVQDGIYDAFLDGFQAHAKRQPASLGNPLASGIIISGPQYQKVVSYIGKAREEGATVYMGGANQAVGSSGFVENTYFVDMKEDMAVVTDEVFGLVATIHRFSTEKEVVEKRTPVNMD